MYLLFIISHHFNIRLFILFPRINQINKLPFFDTPSRSIYMIGTLKTLIQFPLSLVYKQKDVTTNSYAFSIIYLGFFFPVNAGFFFFGAFGFVSTNDPLNISCFVNTMPSFSQIAVICALLVVLQEIRQFLLCPYVQYVLSGEYIGLLCLVILGELRVLNRQYRYRARNISSK